MRDLSSVRIRALSVFCLALVAVFLTTATVFAAEATGQPALSVTSPVSQSVLSSWNPSIVVSASDPAGLESYGTLTIDGVSRTVGVVFPQTGGHWEEDDWDSWWVAEYDYTRGTLSYTPPLLSDGPHTATLTLRNRLGSTNLVTWDFTVKAAPQLSAPVPANGAWVTDLAVAPSVKVADNGAIAATSMTIDGLPVTSVYDTAAKTIKASLTPLGDDALHLVTATARDTSGNEATLQWTFRTRTTPPAFDAPVPAAGSISAVLPPRIAVSVQDSMGVSTVTTATVDGRPVSCYVTYAESGGQWVDDGYDSWWEPTYDYTRGTLNVSTTGLTNGTHTVAVRATNAIGGSGTYSWQFTVAAPPTLTTPSPANGAWSTAPQPTVSAKVTALSAIATCAVTIDGVPASTTYDTVAKLVKGVPLTPLADGLPHAVVASVTDVSGLTGTLSWTFKTRTTGPVLTSQVPAAGATLASAGVSITLSASEPAGFTTVTMKIDGTSVPCRRDYVQTGGQWIDDEYEPWWEPTYDYTRATISYTGGALKDGSHTVAVQATAATGLSTTSTWSFTVASPPVLGATTPADGGWATTLTPTVSIAVSDNGTIASSTMTIDGAPVTTVYDAVTKTVRGVPATPLTDDATHTVSVTARDDGGLTATRTWTFRTRTTSPAYTAATPASGAAVTSYRPRISVSVSDVTGLGTSPVMKLDGVNVPCSFSFLETGGEWVGDEWDSWWEPTYDYTKGTIAYTPSADVANGTHTVWVEAANGIGGRTTHTWDFSVAAPPQLTVASPANGATIATLTPVVSANVKANSAVTSVSATIDGVQTVAVYDAATKVVRAVPLAPLMNESAHTVSFAVTDADGLTASLSWGFRTDITPPVLGTRAPAPGSTVAVANPRVSIDASDWSGMSSAQTMKLDGASVPSLWSFTETGGEWAGDEYDSWWEPTFDFSSGSASYRPVVLRDGPHTVLAQVSNSGGQITTATWTFDVLVPPALSVPAPVDGSWVGTLTPTISVKVAENDTVASTRVAVDGEVIPSSYDPVAKKVVAMPSAPLTDDATHTVVATVTDAAGASGALTWSFRTHASGPQVSAAKPATGTVEWDPVVSVRAQDLSGLDAHPIVKIDGATVPASVDFDVVSEWWVGDEWESWLEQAFDNRGATISYRPAKLSDGPHTAYVQVKNGAGNVTVREWTFEVKAPPKLTDPKPATDSRVSTQTPVISLAVAENSTVASVAATVDGAAAQTEYDAAAGRVKVLPAGALANDLEHTVAVTVTDEAGNSAQLAWAFEVQIHAEMPGTGAPDCLSCHTTYPAAHPMDDCNACHGSGALVEDCRSCHGNGGHGPSEFNDADWGGPYPCTRCHQAGSSAPGHYGTVEGHDTSRDMTACRPCHVTSLTIEHYRYKDEAGAALTCATCHLSTEAGVKAAIANGTTDCASCHDIGAGSHVEQHADSVLSAECLTCHQSNVVTEHLSNPKTQSATLTCDSCHASTAGNVTVAISGGQTACGACHDTASAHGDLMGVHTPQDVASLACGGAGCHAAGDSLALHAGRAEGSCAVCHANPTRGDLTAGKVTAACAGCHATSGTDYHRNMAVHTTSVSTYETCGRCHHAWGSNPIRGHDVTRHAGGCRTCHNGTIDTATLTTDCGQCHKAEGTDYHRQTVAVHTAADAPSQECGRCHDTTNVQVLHEAVGCDACHSNYTCGECHDMHNGQPGTALLSGVSCSNCHTLAGTDYHANVATAHTFGTMQPGCQTAGCHTKDLLAVHAPEVGPGSENPQYEDTCALCHENDDPARVPATATSDCASCHDGHGDIAGLHAARNLPTTLRIFTTSHAPGAEVQVDCGLCHEVGNIVLIHGSDCAKCHGGARDSFTTWNGTCQQGSCHPTYHTEANAGHTAAVDDCSISCHGATTYEIVPENCLECHPGPDAQPPATTSDAEASYVGPATIRLSAADLPAQGSTGVAHTYWILDGAPRAEGVTVLIAQPATGSATHSLAFWSVDAKGNVEPTKTVSLTVTTDVTPPVTTSDAKAEYFRAATIRLTAADNGSSPAVVWYSLDGAAPVSGTSVTVPAPASGTAAHTLEFWAVDAAGNVEQHRNAPFTISADTTAPVTNCDALGSYTDSATVRFTAADQGGSGVAATYWRLDGGTRNTGSTFTASTPGTHTVEYWSVDGAGNEELPHKTATFAVTSANTGTIRFVWQNPPAGAWTYYYVYVYNQYGQLVAQGFNTTGSFEAHVPVSTTPYYLKTYYYDPVSGEEEGPVTSTSSVLIDTPGKIVTWYY